MKKHITIIDYGLGNLHSVVKSMQHIGAEVHLATTNEGIVHADRLILPGVGAFADGIAHLRKHAHDEAIQQFLAKGRPLLGICLGAQLLFDESEEFGVHRGLGVIPGRVVPIPAGTVRVPHVGWGRLVPAAQGWGNSILQGVDPRNWMYFVHSFQMQTREPDHTLARCAYGPYQITAVVRSNQVYGCQFHPEKSGHAGIALLQNFLTI